MISEAFERRVNIMVCYILWDSSCKWSLTTDRSCNVVTTTETQCVICVASSCAACHPPLSASAFPVSLNCTSPKKAPKNVLKKKKKRVVKPRTHMHQWTSASGPLALTHSPSQCLKAGGLGEMIIYLVKPEWMGSWVWSEEVSWVFRGLSVKRSEQVWGF